MATSAALVTDAFPRRELQPAAMRAGDAVDNRQAEVLLRNADVAMYMAKREGKGTYRLFEPEMHAGVLDRLELRADLQRALAQDQFELDFQPVVRLSDGWVTGANQAARHMVAQINAGNDATPLHSSELFAMPFEMLFDAAGRDAFWVLERGEAQGSAAGSPPKRSS